MKRNQIMFYNTTVSEALEILAMESRRDDFGYVGMNRFKMKLNKKDRHVLIILESSLDNVSLEDGIIDLKVDFPHKFRDMESIGRVQEVLKRNPKSKWWKEILEDLQIGSPLSWKIDEILSETEERIENPDPLIQELVNKAVLVQPHNRFFRSLYDQFIGGRDLSERQIEGLKEGLKEAMMFGNQPSNQMKRIEKALSLDPRNSFLLSLKNQSEYDNVLSERQMNVVERIIKDQSSPSVKLLADLKKNVNLSREDFMILQKGQRKGIESLNEEERKRLRHLIYRNQRRLDHSYSKEDIRTMLKKASRIASLDMITEVAIISDINEVFDEDLDNDLDVYVEDTGVDSNGNRVMLCEVENGEYYAIVIDPDRHRDQEVKSVFARKSYALRVFKKLTQNKRRLSSLQKQSGSEVKRRLAFVKAIAIGQKAKIRREADMELALVIALMRAGSDRLADKLMKDIGMDLQELNKWYNGPESRAAHHIVHHFQANGGSLIGDYHSGDYDVSMLAVNALLKSTKVKKIRENLTKRLKRLGIGDGSSVYERYIHQGIEE